MQASLRSKAIIIAALAMFLTGCVYYPKQTERYDASCDLTYKMLVPESKPLTDACAHPTASDPTGVGCLGGTLLLSGTSLIVTNAVVAAAYPFYWLDKEGRCIAKPRPATAQAPAAVP